MLDTFLEELQKMLKSRLFPICIIFSVLFILLVVRLFNLQIVNGEMYEATTESNYSREIYTKATRGNIYDRNGKLLAYNELSYSLQIEDNGEIKTNEEKNRMLYNLIQIVERNQGTILYDFPIAFDEHGKCQFTISDAQVVRFKKDVYSVKELSEEQQNATAEEVFEYLRTSTDTTSPRFVISDEYSREDALKIMSLRYILFINRYTKLQPNFIPITIATNLNEKTVAAIKENKDQFIGVEVVEETRRVYNYSEYFAGILGYTGVIGSDALQELKDKGDTYYAATDQIGKIGLEKDFEEYLRGTKGYQKVIKNSSNRIVRVEETKEPVAGNDLYLTIDADLQKAAYQMLERELASVLLGRIVNSMSYGSKGTSAEKITIPIYDVYFALLDNNVISISHFKEDDATDLEKQVYRKFEQKRERVFRDLRELLKYHNTFNTKSLSEEKRAYLNSIYNCLKNNGIILTSQVDTTDSVYTNFQDGKIGLNDYLVHALENNWIDLSILDVGEDYYSSEELYEKLIEYTLKLLENDLDFSKKIYKYLIYSYELSGREICLLLFDQNVLKYKEEDVQALQYGTKSPYSFITSKIRKLEITPAQLALEPCSGSVVITDPNSGDTLACVSYPSYDNNRLANTVDSKYYASLINDKSLPLLNRATKQSTAPGSTFKTFSSIVALEEGVVGHNETIVDKVQFEKFANGPKCWSKTSHGAIDAADAIGVSCNYFFYECGWRLSQDSRGNYVSNIGLSKIQKYAKKFHLDAKSGIELSEDAPHISDESAVPTMIGQGTNLFAPVQLSRWVTTVSNEGTVYDLTLIDKITDKNGKVVLKNKAKVRDKIDIRKATWDEVQLGMYKVVNGEHSSIDDYFKDLSVTVAGKSGTAQVSKTIPSHALFISYAPYEKPEITVTTVIPNGYTSSNSAELASNIYKYYFDKEKTVLENDVSSSNSRNNSLND